VHARLALLDLIQPVRYNLANHIRNGISLSSLPGRNPSRRHARRRASTDFDKYLTDVFLPPLAV